MVEKELHERIKEITSKHEELTRLVSEKQQELTEKHEALSKDLESLKAKPAKTGRDTWDKLSALTPLISGVLLSAIGLYFTHSNNTAQHKIQEVQTMEKLMPHLAGDESEKKMAIIAISTLTTPETAAKIAQLFPSKGTVSALESIAHQGGKKEKMVAKKALASSYKTLGKASESVNAADPATALNYYQQELQVQKDVYGQDSTEIVDTYVRVGRALERQGKYAEAATSYDKARKIMKSKNKTQSSDFRTILRALARVYRLQGKTNLAQDFSQRAKKLSDAKATIGSDGIVSAPLDGPVGGSDPAQVNPDFVGGAAGVTNDIGNDVAVPTPLGGVAPGSPAAQSATDGATPANKPSATGTTSSTSQ